MSDEHTPTTEEVRGGYADAQTGIASRLQMHREDFDRWLAQYTAEAERRGAVNALRAAQRDIAGENSIEWARSADASCVSLSYAIEGLDDLIDELENGDKG